MAKKAVKKKPPAGKKGTRHKKRRIVRTAMVVALPSTIQFHRIANLPPVPGGTYPIVGGVLDVMGFHSANPAMATVALTLYSATAPVSTPANVAGNQWSVSIAGVNAGDYLLEATLTTPGTIVSNWITITIP